MFERVGAKKTEKGVAVFMRTYGMAVEDFVQQCIPPGQQPRNLNQWEKWFRQLQSWSPHRSAWVAAVLRKTSRFCPL
jgi:hypothetical protein